MMREDRAPCGLLLFTCGHRVVQAADGVASEPLTWGLGLCAPQPVAFLITRQPCAILHGEKKSGRYFKHMASSGFLMLCFGFVNRSRASGEERRKPVCSLSRGTWIRKGEGNPAVRSLQTLPG